MTDQHSQARAHGDRHGARQPERFDPARAAMLDDPARFVYLPPADVLALLDAPHGASVVDFGTGTGAYAFAIAKLRPDLRVVALDEQPQMIALLQKRLQTERGLTITPSGTGDLTTLHRTAARVLAINVLHELGDTALRSLGALLAPAGKAVIIDWNAAVERDVGPPRDHVYTVDEACDRLQASGLTVIAKHVFAYHYALVAQKAAT
ncbi:MAG: class I SAM-dependent methyltransferase [Candidatus Eremiobacteraeota bacterium]|nr:class I SAM-dependent methyltransferase [Candidatus Eremiobacteraeota bacterium]